MKRCLAHLVASVALFGWLAGPSAAHIVIEEPWHPAAAAYRTMMFLGDLQPVPWSGIAFAYHFHNQAAVGNRPAVDFVNGLAGGLSQAIDEAIVAEDRQALYAAATTALSRLVQKALDLARASLATPGTARRHLDDARALYRALDDFVQQADPDGARAIGLAWLELSNSVGSAGVLGRGAAPTDEADFDAASTVIADYLVANFEPTSVTERTSMVPLPETIVAESGEVAVAPWLPPGTNLNDQVPLPKLFLNFEEKGIDEADLPLIAYGDMLFDSPEIFGDPARSLGLTCSTCHNRSDINQAFFIPGISPQAGAVDVDGHFFNSLFNDRRDDALDIPSLRGIRFLGPYGRDGRLASLREFTRTVIVSEFAGDEPTPFMLDTLVAYMLEFDLLPNGKVDGQGILTNRASAAVQRGETLFRRPFAELDGRSCASCHIPSANFIDRRSHDIGSGEASYDNARDGAFDTPTLLGTRFTAPYFHDGSLPTLAGVVDWFDATFELGLADDERADLTAYVEAVGDSDEPYQIFDDRNTPFRLAWEELTTFASTLDTLLPKRDAFHARLLIDTVAPDLVADASVMGNFAAKPDVYRLSAVLEEVGKAIDERAWDLAQDRWQAFKALQDRLDPEMF